jgi:hypothetical protein
MRTRCGLSVCDNVSVRFFDPFNLMNFRDHDIAERSFILRGDKEEDVRLAKAGMGLFHSGKLL